MKSTQYSDKVLDHFRNPRNVGTLEGKDVSVGRVGNPVCGDVMEIYIKVNENRIEDIKLKTFGCGSAIATASMVTEMAKGKTIEEALKITRNDVANELEGLPPIKMHCSNLAADALQDAIKNHLEKHDLKSRPAKTKPETEKEIKGYQQFLGKGIFHQLNDLSLLKDKRVLFPDTGLDSVELAKKAVNYTARVIFVTDAKEISIDPVLLKDLRKSGVKLLFESEVIEARGFKEVEKVLIHDLDEDEEYELYVDMVVII